MDALARRRRSLLIGALLALAALAACARSAPPSEIGVSAQRAGAGPRDAGATELVDGAAALPAGYRTTFAKVNRARFVSQGHAAGRWEIDVWANELAQKALATRSRAVPQGAIAVVEHFERGAGGKAGPVMVMEKREPGFAKEHGDWRWAIVGSQGQLVQDGVVEQCAGCHDDAPADGFFPIIE